MLTWRKNSGASDRPAGAKSNGRSRTGNGAGAPRFLKGGHSQIQRDGDGPKLTPPSILQPNDPLARYRPSFGLQYQVPSANFEQLRLQLSGMLDPARLQPMLLAAVPGGSPAAAPAGPRAAPAAATAPTGNQPAAAPSPQTPAAPAADPAVPGQTPQPARPAGAGDIISAVAALPQVTRLLETTRDRTLGRFSQSWNSSGTGDRAGLVAASIVVGGAMLAPIVAFPGPRQTALSLLNGQVIPVPLLPGYGVEFNFVGNSVLVGVHVDVGQLLPSSWGFGPGSPTPLTPPQNPPIPPAPGAVNRMEDSATTPVATPGLSARINAALGGGSALAPSMKAHGEAALETDLSRVRIHTGANADGLARELGAKAFTIGQDIFFRSGRFAPENEAGRRLMMHELVHTVQQADGAISSQATMRISDPRDPQEREAHAISELSPADGSRSPSGPLKWNASSIQRTPDAPQPAKGHPATAAEVQTMAPPQWTDYFDEVVPAILEASEGNEKVGLQKALWLVVQAYAEQGPGVGPPSQHRNRLFNEQGEVIRDKNQKIVGVVPGQEQEGAYLYNLPQNESPERGKTDIKTSPTFGYVSPELSAKHHLEQMQKRWKPAWGALTAEHGSFEEFAAALKRSGYAKADTYDTDLIALEGQVRSQVVAWLKYRIPELRARIPRMEAYLAYIQENRDVWRKRVQEAPDPVGANELEADRLEAMGKVMEAQIADARTRLARMERFAALLGVKIAPAGR